MAYGVDVQLCLNGQQTLNRILPIWMDAASLDILQPFLKSDMWVSFATDFPHSKLQKKSGKYLESSNEFPRQYILHWTNGRLFPKDPFELELSSSWSWSIFTLLRTPRGWQMFAIRIIRLHPAHHRRKHQCFSLLLPPLQHYSTSFDQRIWITESTWPHIHESWRAWVNEPKHRKTKHH